MLGTCTVIDFSVGSIIVIWMEMQFVDMHEQNKIYSIILISEFIKSESESKEGWLTSNYIHHPEIYFRNVIFQIFIAAFALVYGDPLRVVNGYDSFGNVCGSDNMDMKDHKGLEFSGYDMTDYKCVRCCFFQSWLC